MQRSATGPERLNPRRLLDHFKRIIIERKNALDEVFIRRILSAIYLSLFNYWSLKRYHRGMRSNKSRFGDNFRYSDFNKDMLRHGLDYAIYTVYLYRVAADHYALNPTKVRLTSRPWRGIDVDVEINNTILERTLEAAYDIMEVIEQS